MDTQALRLFVLSADKLNISAAGRALGLAPAVASARLSKLEQQMGADLLHRTTRKVALSLEGAEFLPFAREILAQEDAALVALGRGQAEVSGTLRFTAPSTFAQLYIAPLLPEFLDRYPGVKLDLRFSDVQLDLIEGSFDLALRNSMLEDSSLKGRKLASDTRILCAAPAYLARFGTPQTIEELQSHQVIAFQGERGRRFENEDGDTWVLDPAAPQCRLILDDGQSQKRATMAGAGISANSLWSVHQELADGSLVQIFPDYHMSDESVLWLVYPKSNVLSAKVRVFMDYLLEKIGRAPIWTLPK